MDKIVRKAKKTIAFLAISTVCAILLGIVFINNSNEAKKVGEGNTGIHLSKIKNANELAYIDSETEPVKFARSDDDDIFSFVLDNKKIYVVQLTEEEENDINNYFKSNTAKYNIKGESVEFTDELKSLAIEGYNKLTNSNELNSDNFEYVFGDYYIDANSWETDEIGYEVFAIFLFIVAFITGIETLKRIKILKKTLNSDKYKKAIKEEVLAEYKNVVFTKNYMIAIGRAFDIIDNSSIVWAYHYIFKYKFMPNHNFIYYLKDKKRHSINFWFSGGEVDKIIEYISNTNSKALVGYTEDNVEKFKNMHKQDI